MIVVYGGLQADNPDAEEPRIPRREEEALKARIKNIISHLRPTRMVGSIATGADIFFAQSAIEEGIPIDILLPSSVEYFRDFSISPKGERWGSIFDSIVNSKNINLKTMSGIPKSSEDFKEHNKLIIDHAEQICHKERIWVLVVVQKDSDKKVTVTEHMANIAESRRHFLLEISPAQKDITCFVAMPYGEKYELRTGKYINCDLAFDKIYLPLIESEDLKCIRSDLNKDSGVIQAKMIFDVVNSDIVLADLTTSNFNVAYELGVRHALSKKPTVLVSPKFKGFSIMSTPFDVEMMRVYHFNRGSLISDQQAEHAIRGLKSVLNASLEKTPTSNPLYMWFDLSSLKPPLEYKQQVIKFNEIEKDLEVKVKNAVLSTLGVEEVVNCILGEKIQDEVKLRLLIRFSSRLRKEGRYNLAELAIRAFSPTVESSWYLPWVKESVIVYRRIAESSNGCSCREKYWRRANELLLKAEMHECIDSEMYGIWGGLLKREANLELVNGIKPIDLLAQMRERYRKGFDLRPNFYNGLNLAMSIGVYFRYVNKSESSEIKNELAGIISITRYLADKAIQENSQNYWAIATKAELLLLDSMVNRKMIKKSKIKYLYEKAAQNGSFEQIEATKYQLNFLANSGYSRKTIDEILRIVESIETHRGLL